MGTVAEEGVTSRAGAARPSCEAEKEDADAQKSNVKRATPDLASLEIHSEPQTERRTGSVVGVTLLPIRRRGTLLYVYCTPLLWRTGGPEAAAIFRRAVYQTHSDKQFYRPLTLRAEVARQKKDKQGS